MSLCLPPPIQAGTAPPCPLRPPPVHMPAPAGGLLTVGWRSGCPTCTDPPPGPQAELFYWKKKRRGLGLCSWSPKSRTQRAPPIVSKRRCLRRWLLREAVTRERGLATIDTKRVPGPGAPSPSAAPAFSVSLLGQVEGARPQGSGPDGGQCRRSCRGDGCYSLAHRTPPGPTFTIQLQV